MRELELSLEFALNMRFLSHMKLHPTKELIRSRFRFCVYPSPD